jgi:GDPmannose 4,6-dehydratase
MKKNKAIVTGITGQDGAYLTQLLLEKGYKVFGTFRRAASTNFWRLDELGCLNHPNLELLEYDLTDLSTNIRMLERTRPTEIYNLAAQSFVAVSFDQPILTATNTGLSALNLLEAIRIVDKNIKFYQASTSEMFGMVQEIPQSETTPLYPRSPYGCAKVFAHHTTVNYAESYDLFASSGILFNHESPLRGLEFVTRKITNGLAKVKLGKQPLIELGNLEAKRDWGFAGDYVEGMWRILQAKQPDTFVLATGRTETVKHFVEMSCKALELEIEWHGHSENEKGIDSKTGKTIVKVNEKFYRPAEVDILVGDPTKATALLGWEANTTLEELCSMMVKSDLKRVESGFMF